MYEWRSRWSDDLDFGRWVTESDIEKHKAAKLLVDPEYAGLTKITLRFDQGYTSQFRKKKVK